MDSRTASHVLSQIASYLELRGENRFKAQAYQTAAKGILTLNADDLRPLLESGEIGRVRGLGPATLAVVRDLVETGSSRYLDQLREATPEGLLDLLAIPGLTPEKIHKIHKELEIADVAQLEEAARDGRLAKVRGFGPKTAEKILKGIAFSRETGILELYPRARAEAEQLVRFVREHPEVDDTAIAGAIRRHREVVRGVTIVARCLATANPVEVATSFTRISGVKSAKGAGTDCVDIHFVDGARLTLRCAHARHFAVALWRATGTEEHVELVRARLTERGIGIIGDELHDASQHPMDIPDEQSLYRAAGLAYVPAELREAQGEVDAASRDALPRLLLPDDIRGVLHCHTHYSDGKSSIREIALGARARGWSYVGISDHSAAAFYASGLPREKVLAQFEEIDTINAEMDTGFRILKGIEADILADGRLDYDAELLSQFDFVIGSIHSRFGMDGPAMTERVLRALDEPFLTILAHPTGRLLLSREPYAIDVDAVIEKSVEVGVAVELNADPHRLDLDWRHLITAKRRGATIALGPDAHSVNALDNVALGVGMARKGWLEATDLLNAREADDVIAFARSRWR
ncbi:MAG TPA: PHP domain-containing protein [Gemmatimonadaceae bacterium]|nr:PHP domain-containing protein [Gemmatimonadaceae bacterium]